MTNYREILRLHSLGFNKYYADYLVKANATMHLNHKPGEIMQVDWAGDTAVVIDTDTGEIIPSYVFVATLPYSGYSYVEAFFSVNQEAWTTAHVNAFKYFGGVARIIQCDNLKTCVQCSEARKGRGHSQQVLSGAGGALRNGDPSCQSPFSQGQGSGGRHRRHHLYLHSGGSAEPPVPVSAGTE